MAVAPMLAGVLRQAQADSAECRERQIGRSLCWQSALLVMAAVREWFDRA